MPGVCYWFTLLISSQWSNSGMSLDWNLVSYLPTLIDVVMQFLSWLQWKTIVSSHFCKTSLELFLLYLLSLHYSFTLRSVSTAAPACCSWTFPSSSKFIASRYCSLSTFFSRFFLKVFKMRLLDLEVWTAVLDLLFPSSLLGYIVLFGLFLFWVFLQVFKTWC